MTATISNVVLLDTLKTDDGECVPPGTYPVTRVCLRESKRGAEKDLFYLDGFDGICIELTGLYVLKQMGKVDFSFA